MSTASKARCGSGTTRVWTSTVSYLWLVELSTFPEQCSDAMGSLRSWVYSLECSETASALCCADDFPLICSTTGL